MLIYKTARDKKEKCLTNLFLSFRHNFSALIPADNRSKTQFPMN